MRYYLILLLHFTLGHASHFNGGTVTWKPVDAHDNSSSVTITIDQSYWWTYPTIACANNVPITTSGRASQASNLTCVVDCSTDGGYSTKPIKTLTDCTSVSTSLGMLTSQRSQNVTLTAGAHFHLAYVGSAWLGIGKPAVAGLEWSITTAIDLRMRPDGFINTPPVAAIISPQHIFVNRTSEIRIPVSDANVGDDVRCRWATYTSGYRRRRELDPDSDWTTSVAASTTPMFQRKNVLIRNGRGSCSSNCGQTCDKGCRCSCAACQGTTCSGSKCNTSPQCLALTTTVETTATLKPTSTYPVRQSINECGDICYPTTLPANTSLSNCTLSIKGLTANTWYAASIQIEDFISTSSSTPMSSVPVQFLIYVMPEPTCDDAPLITPLTGCMEVTVGVPFTFNLTVVNQCDPSAIDMADVIVSKVIAGMQKGNLTKSPSNASQTTVPFTWTPQASQIGEQQMCVVAYTEEEVQSGTYCVTFSVIWSAWVCATTTTTTVTSSTTSSTSTATTSTTVTTATTVTTISTSSTSSSSSSTSTSTSASSTSSSTTVTTTSSTSATSVATANATRASAATTSSSRGPSWGLIAGISSISLPLALCTFCCLHRLLWVPAARRRRQERELRNKCRYSQLSGTVEGAECGTGAIDERARIRKPSKAYQIYNILYKKEDLNSTGSTVEHGSSMLVTIYNNTKNKRANTLETPFAHPSPEAQSAWMESQTHEALACNIEGDRRGTTRTDAFGSGEAPENLNVSQLFSDQDRSRAGSTTSEQADRGSSLDTPLYTLPVLGPPRRFSVRMLNLMKVAPRHLLGFGQSSRRSQAQ